MFGRERKSRPARLERQTAGRNSSKPNQANQNPNRFKSKVEMTEEILEAELDQHKRPKFKVSTQSLCCCNDTSSCYSLIYFLFHPLGGAVVRSTRVGEDHFGSYYSKACWVQCGGNECQVSWANLRVSVITVVLLVWDRRLCWCFHSDDRSAEVFQKRIDTATQMKSVLGVNEKPNCLIIDEIDGAPTVSSGEESTPRRNNLNGMFRFSSF